jgi:hypothetical protein
VSGRAAAFVAAIVACGVVIAQIVFAGQALFHTWQYAVALAVLGWLFISAAARAMRSGSRWFAVSMLGALFVVATGLASGLLGPDTESVSRAPGTILPLPEIGAAAVFTNADAQGIANGDSPVVLRRRNRTDIVVTPGSKRFLGGTMLISELMPAAYIDATDEGGNHLTVTQPTGTAFLSPVLLFREQQTIAGTVHPVDAFSLPGAKRNVKAVYFNASDAVQLHLPPSAAGKPALLYDVFDAASDRSVGIGVAASGGFTDIGGVRLHATLGRYPRLVVASTPQPLALIFGLVLFAVGFLASLLQPDNRAMRESESHEEEHGNREHRVRTREQET